VKRAEARLDHVVLEVADPIRSAEFYCDVLRLLRRARLRTRPHFRDPDGITVEARYYS